MTAIVSVVNDVTVEDASHWNQYAAALSNVLGITDTTQDALGRLVLPRSSAAPGSPTEAQVYLDTDEGRPYFYSGAAWKPLRRGILTFGGTTAGTVNSTHYPPPGRSAASAPSWAIEINYIVMPFAGRMTKFYVNSRSDLTATATYTARKNQVDQALVVELASGADAGNDVNPAHVFSFVAGDRISVKRLIPNSGTGGVADVEISLEFED